MLGMNSHTPLPWPDEGAVVMQRPNDAIDRANNYRRARECVAACWPFTQPARSIKTLFEGAQVAYAVLPVDSALRAELGALLTLIEQSKPEAVPA
jgi:hypothetical protein